MPRTILFLLAFALRSAVAQPAPPGELLPADVSVLLQRTLGLPAPLDPLPPGEAVPLSAEIRRLPARDYRVYRLRGNGHPLVRVAVMRMPARPEAERAAHYELGHKLAKSVEEAIGQARSPGERAEIERRRKAEYDLIIPFADGRRGILGAIPVNDGPQVGLVAIFETRDRHHEVKLVAGFDFESMAQRELPVWKALLDDGSIFDRMRQAALGVDAAMASAAGVR